MRNRLFVVVILLASLSLACGFNVSTANISDAKMATDPDGNNPTTVFSPEDVFYAVVNLSNAPDDTTVKAAWVVVEAEGVDENMTVDEAELTSGSGILQFDLTNDNLWPPGKYKVDLYLNGELDRSLEFEVEGQPVAAEPTPTDTPEPEPTATPKPEPTATPKQSTGDSLGGGKSTEKAEGDSLAGVPEPLPMQSEPYVHSSGAFSFAVPEGWELYNEDDLSGAFGDDQSRVGAVFVNVGADQMTEEEILDFINSSLDIIVDTFADGYEILGENNKLAEDGIYFVATSFSEGDGRAEFFFEPRDSVVFIFYFTSLRYAEMEPTWNAIIDSYGIDVDAALLADPAPTPTVPPTPTPKPKPKPAANPYKPPAGVARVFLQNKYPNEYNIDFGDGSGSIQVPPNAQNFYHDVPPGNYNPGLSLPGGGAANVQFEIKADEAWVILVDGSAGVKFGKVYPR